MTREYGGPVKPVKVVTDAELYDNGGIYKLIGQKVAVRVSNYDALTGLQRLQGGASIPVYPITQAQVDSGEYKLLGGSAQPVIEITKLAADFEATKNTYGQAAIPVLVVSGAAMQGAGAGAAPIVYLLKDEFTTPESAPLTSPRTCEPGPGTLTVTDTDNRFSIAANSLVLSAGIADATIVGDSLAQLSGRAAAALGYVRTASGCDFGWGLVRIQLFGGSIIVDQGNVTTYETFSDADRYVVVRRSDGRFVFIYNNVIPWVGYNVLATDQQPRYDSASNTAVASLDAIRVADLTTPWDSDNGIATDVLAGARSDGDTFTHEADCHIHIDMDTIPSSGEFEFRFRIQDASNYWRVTIDSLFNLDLDEVVAGTPTQRGTFAGGSYFNGIRLSIVCKGENIGVYERTNRRISYTSAANFKTATSGKLETEGTGGAFSDIVTYPYTLSGGALSVLDSFFL